jgi:hypothetical protein
MEYQTILASGIMGMVGTAVGAILNNQLSKSSQRSQWLADAKKAEYKELLTTLNECFVLIVELSRPGVARDPEGQRELLRTAGRSMRAISDKIYIADVIIKLDLMNRWETAVTNFKSAVKVKDFDFETEVQKMSEEIRRAALKDH